MSVLSNDLRKTLIEAARHARQWAYVPYSHYPVGAALLTDSGKIYDGVNIENAAYPTGICAERVAVFKAVSEGEHKFSAIAIMTSNGGMPCGSCRQVMAEFNYKMTVIIANEKGQILKETSLEKLLPDAFLPEDLK
jgi:cytidine deaminase